MVAAIIVAHLWAVGQLTALGSFARTIGVRTLLRAMAAGFYVCGPCALLLQYPMALVVTALGGVSLHNAVPITGYTTDPWVEEIVKVVPVLVLLRLGAVRRQWSLTDCTLLAAAAGSGFGLAEDLFRYGAAAAAASWGGDGWTLGTSISLPFVPGFAAIFTSWLPRPVSGNFISLRIEDPEMPWVNLHVAWSSTVGFAAGLWCLYRGRAAKMIGVAVLTFAALDHAAFNATGEYGSWMHSVMVPPFAAIRGSLRWRPVIVLTLAWWLDRRRQRPADGVATRLADGPAANRWPVGLRATLARLPGSLLAMDRFVRLRRAYYTAIRTDVAGNEDLRAALLAARAAVVGGGGRDDRRARGFSRHWSVLRTPSAIASLVAVVPTLLFFVVGGWPQSAPVQSALLHGPGWWIIRFTSVVAFALTIWRVALARRSWQVGTHQPSSDDVASFVLGCGAVAGGGVLLGTTIWNIVWGASATMSTLTLHILDAAGSSKIGPVAMLGAVPAGLNLPHAMQYPPGIEPVTSDRDLSSATQTGSGTTPPSRGAAANEPLRAEPDDEMSLDEMAAWAAEADARDAAQAAQAALDRAAQADATLAGLNRAEDEASAAWERALEEENAAKQAAKELDPSGEVEDNANRAREGILPQQWSAPPTAQQQDAVARLARAISEEQTLFAAKEDLFHAMGAAKTDADARAGDANAAIADAQDKALDAEQARRRVEKP